MIFAFFRRINSVRVVYDRREVRMAKKWKRILAAGMTAGLLMTCGSQPVFAQSDSLIDAILDEKAGANEITAEETTEDFSEDTSYSMLRGTKLKSRRWPVMRLLFMG